MPRSGVVLLCLVPGLYLAACASDPAPAPVEERRGVQRAVATPTAYTVIRGDTLYSIAWRYGLDYRDLASANSVPRPYTIYPGQVLSLEKPTVTGKASQKSAAPPARPAPAAKAPATVTKASPPRDNNSDTVSAGGPVAAWRWPTAGTVVRGFSGTVHKGIDIDGEAGDRVSATAAGIVVYAGSGIVGYGQLLIIKHNDTYLSAYGHNRRLLVNEGQAVAAGQQIAEKGSSATNSVKLHFEIRREGKPIDPKTLLPRR